jgi:hypothetical protein
MGLDNSRLFICSTIKLGLAKTFNQSKRLALKSTIKTSASATMNEFDKL